MTDDERRRIHQSDLEKINAAADYLNAEANDLLACQVDLFESFDLDETLLGELVRVPVSDADIDR
jgi:hypothetical protein